MHIPEISESRRRQLNRSEEDEGTMEKRKRAKIIVLSIGASSVTLVSLVLVLGRSTGRLPFPAHYIGSSKQLQA